MMYLYWLSLVVIISAAIVIALADTIPGGPLGTILLGGVAVSGVVGFEQSPSPGTVMQNAFIAASCVWAAWMWRRGNKRRVARGQRPSRCQKA